MTKEHEAARVVVLEVHRDGRRPRYHRGARLDNFELVKPESCNTDQAARVVLLDRLPEHIPHPWSQLCHRCWAGTTVLEAAVAAGALWHSQAPARAAARAHRAERHEARLARLAART